MASALPAVILVTGPTAIGKSALAIALARHLDGEIINADSQQLYRGCDIGTGKVPPQNRGGIPHHLFDVIAPDQQCNVAQFMALADSAIAEIRSRGHWPIVVGGTGLYLKTLVWGLCEAPPQDAAVRRELDALLRREGSAALHGELQRVDPALAAQIHPHHSTRLMRALEVWRLTGRSLAAWQAAHAHSSPRYRTRWIGLTCDRSLLRERIATRVAQQIADGWVDEVRQLLQQYGPNAPIFRAIGYRELAAFVQHGGELPQIIRGIVTATQQYAKRQMTYLRKIPDMAWHDVTHTTWPTLVQQVAATLP